MNQLSFFEEPKRPTLEQKIDDLQTKITNIRSGLFKRYSECEKAIEFLEGEIEDLVKEFVCKKSSSQVFPFPGEHQFSEVEELIAQGQR